MVSFIGSTAITSIQELRLSTGKKVSEFDLVDKDNQLVVEGEVNGQVIEIDYTLLPNIHPENLSVEEQRQEVKNLSSDDYSNNTFRYNILDGFVSVESVSIDEKSDQSNLRTGTISGLFLPWPKYDKFNPSFFGYGSGTYGDGIYKGDSSYGFGLYGEDNYNE